MPVSSTYSASPKITSLGEGFYDEVVPAAFPEQILRFRNQRWADRVGLGSLDGTEWAKHFASFAPLPDNLEKPLALRYHGHQFDTYNPSLGDGRGFLFAQLRDDAGRLLDLGTKGSGTTPWSRGGDGRLTLKGGVREVLATEMLEARGVYTSKTLSLFETGERLERGDEPSPTRSSVLVRLSHSHVRFGTFQRLAFSQDVKAIEKLVAYSIEHYFPEIDGGDRVARFLDAAIRKSAALTASWMAAGFVHGVLNSDNMTITGESFDYGPYRFLPTYDLGFTAAYFDHTGLYAYGHQPRAVVRNLMRLGSALRVLEPALDLQRALEPFEEILQAEALRRVLGRLGLRSSPDHDDALMGAIFDFLDHVKIGFDRFFFDMHGGRAREAKALAGPAKEHYAGPSWDALRAALAPFEPVKDVFSPYHAGDGPETLVIDEIERIWDAIAARDDWAPFEQKIARIRSSDPS